MSVKIRLKRTGKKREPFYRIVITDSRNRRDGRVIEEVGTYYSKSQPSQMEVKSERVQHWLGVGARPSDAVFKILTILGEMDKFAGNPNAKSKLEIAKPKESVEKLIQDVADLAEKVKADVAKKKSQKPAPAKETPSDETEAPVIASEGEAERGNPETPSEETPESVIASEGEAERGNPETSETAVPVVEDTEPKEPETAAAPLPETNEVSAQDLPEGEPDAPQAEEVKVEEETPAEGTPPAADAAEPLPAGAEGDSQELTEADPKREEEKAE